jgi:hypothetical protein
MEGFENENMSAPVNPSDLLLASLDKYYSIDGTFEIVQKILRNEGVSLRSLDWFVTNFAKKNNVTFKTSEGIFNVFLEYKAQLKSFSKKYFDPFCRGDRLEYRGIGTTVGQLNFFRWSLKNGVVEYCTQHASEIEDDMMESVRRRRAAEPGDKRRELSKAAIKRCMATTTRVTIRFE